MWSQSLFRRTSAALAALWLTATSALSPVMACEAHGGTAHHGAVAAATAADPSHQGDHHDAPAAHHDALPADASPGAHGGSHTHEGEAAHHGHAAPASVVSAHCAPTADVDAHAPDDSAPCTCTGECCPHATVATPGLAPALTRAVVAALPTFTLPTTAPASPASSPRRIQPPATAPPAHTPA
ncbi:MAG: hypothetical protein MUF40_03125 [Gemmatimonadaceae bacterium]|nr:hypothetical protein [Gemmatimonadaceae bacterium]